MTMHPAAADLAAHLIDPGTPSIHPARVAARQDPHRAGAGAPCARDAARRDLLDGPRKGSLSIFTKPPSPAVHTVRKRYALDHETPCF